MLLALLALTIAIAVWGARRTHNAADFAIASGRMGPWVAALGYAGGAINAWTLLFVVAAAFTWGYAALWIWVGLVLGCIVNWWFVAPRLRALSATQAQGSFTVLQVATADAGERLQPLVARSIVLIVAFAALLQIGAMLQAVSAAFAARLGFDAATSIVILTGMLTAGLFAGGLWAASAADAAHTIMLMMLALLLPLPALIATGGLEAMQQGFAALGPHTTDWLGGRRGVVAIAFVAGALGLGLALLGQPQALNRPMALRDERSLRKARWLAIAWVAVLLAAVLLCGWCASVLYAGLEHPRDALFAIADRLLPPWLATVLVLLLLAAILLSAGNLLFVLATSLAIDLRRPGAPLSMPRNRLALLGAGVLACGTSLYAPTGALDQTLLGFTALGASLGPLLIVRMSGKRIRPGSTLGAIWAGFVLSLMFHLLPDSPGNFLERVLPFTAGLGIALTGGERRRNPDRADRSQETVHDRVPI